MDKSILNLLNDDVVLDKPEDSLKEVSDNITSDVIPPDNIKETEFVSNDDKKTSDLILNKEEYSKSLRAKLYPVDQGLPVSPDSNDKRITQNKDVQKSSLAFLKEKLQGVLKELEELENEEKIIDEEVAGATGIPGGAAAAIGEGTTTDAVALYKEKIGKFSMFKRK